MQMLPPTIATGTRCSVRCISCISAREYKSLFAKMRINDLVSNKSVGFDCPEHRRYLAFCLRTKLKSTRARFLCLKTSVQRRLEHVRITAHIPYSARKDS